MRPASPSVSRIIAVTAANAMHHDALHRRVHPALPASCSAKGLSPYPSLWSARQRHPQSQCASRERTACNRNAERDTGACLGARSTPAMPMLRRPHDRNRDHQWRRPATRTTSLAHRFRDDGIVTPTIMTRLNKNQLRADATLLRPTGSYVPTSVAAIQMTVMSSCFSQRGRSAGVPEAHLIYLLSPRRGRSRSSFCLRHGRERLKSP